MKYRYMRILLFFDLPVTSSSDRHEYNVFHRYLIKNGFMMLQESVYCKLALNASAVQTVVANLYKNKPPEGLVQILTVTEKQYSKMEYILGEYKSEIIDTDERLIIL